MNKIIIMLVLMCISTADAMAQKYQLAKELYLFGTAFSLTDSTVYVTDIQPVENAYLQKRTKFLYARNEYSIQLSSHLKGTKTIEHPTTSVSFAKKQKKIDKKMAKLKKKLNKDGYLIKVIPVADFKFKGIAYSEPEVEETAPLTKEEKKAKKAAEKKAEKDKKKALKDKKKAEKDKIAQKKAKVKAEKEAYKAKNKKK